MKVIIVTGSVGSGKTTYAKKIAKQKKFKYVDINQFIKKNNLVSGYDKKRKANIIETKKLNKELVKFIEQKRKENILGLIIDSHLSHDLPQKYVDLCIVTKCNLKTLKKRLEKRKYSNEKIRENLDCEIFDVCLIEAQDADHKIKIIHT